jgi:hypothetical protein
MTDKGLNSERTMPGNFRNFSEEFHGSLHSIHSYSLIVMNELAMYRERVA